MVSTIRLFEKSASREIVAFLSSVPQALPAPGAAKAMPASTKMAALRKSEQTDTDFVLRRKHDLH